METVTNAASNGGRTIPITTALGEIKTTKAQLEKARENVLTHLCRDSDRTDPMAKSGGSEQYIGQQLQKIGDLERKVVLLRTAVQQANLSNSLTVQGRTLNVAEWLVEKREIAKRQGEFHSLMAQRIAQRRRSPMRETASFGRTRRRQSWEDDEDTPRTTKDVIVHLDEKKLAEDMEKHELVWGELDAALSLFNASTMVTVPS